PHSLLLPHFADPELRYAFPTRRSSDLAGLVERVASLAGDANRRADRNRVRNGQRDARALHQPCQGCGAGARSTSNRGYQGASIRSEEHTSELQSQSNLVCRLLLEKKKK